MMRVIFFVTLLLISLSSVCCHADDIHSLAESKSFSCPQKQLATDDTSVQTSYTILQDEDDGELYIKVRVVYEGQAWVGFGFSRNDRMILATLIMGFPGFIDVRKYTATNYDPAGSGIPPLSEKQQTLKDTLIEQNSTSTVLEFRKKLVEENEVPINLDGTNYFMYAYGFGNDFGTHENWGVFKLEGDLCKEEDNLTVLESGDSYTEYYAAHGILAAIAWGVLTPLAIGMSVLRKWVTCGKVAGLWYKIHFYVNLLALLMNIISFALAVSAHQLSTPEGEDPQHFTGFAHASIGLAIMILLFLQVLGGFLRPDKDKVKIRFFWFSIHRWLGLGLVVLCWYQVHDGLMLFSGLFNTPSYIGAFWGVTGTITGIISIMFIYGLFFKKPDDEAVEKDSKIEEGADYTAGVSKGIEESNEPSEKEDKGQSQDTDTPDSNSSGNDKPSHEENEGEEVEPSQDSPVDDSTENNTSSVDEVEGKEKYQSKTEDGADHTEEVSKDIEESNYLPEEEDKDQSQDTPDSNSSGNDIPIPEQNEGEEVEPSQDSPEDDSTENNTRSVDEVEGKEKDRSKIEVGADHSEGVSEDIEESNDPSEREDKNQSEDKDTPDSTSSGNDKPCHEENKGEEVELSQDLPEDDSTENNISSVDEVEGKEKDQSKIEVVADYTEEVSKGESNDPSEIEDKDQNQDTDTPDSNSSGNDIPIPEQNEGEEVEPSQDLPEDDSTENNTPSVDEVEGKEKDQSKTEEGADYTEEVSKDIEESNYLPEEEDKDQSQDTPDSNSSGNDKPSHEENKGEEVEPSQDLPDDDSPSLDEVDKKELH